MYCLISWKPGQQFEAHSHDGNDKILRTNKRDIQHPIASKKKKWVHHDPLRRALICFGGLEHLTAIRDVRSTFLGDPRCAAGINVLYVVVRELGFCAAGSANLQCLPGLPNSRPKFSPNSLQICRYVIFTNSRSFFVVN